MAERLALLQQEHSTVVTCQHVALNTQSMQYISGEMFGIRIRSPPFNIVGVKCTVRLTGVIIR